MRQRARTDVSIVADVAAIASTPGTASQRAQALLDSLRQVVAFDAAHIALRNPERRRQPPAVRRGYPDTVRRYLDSTAFVDDLERLGLHRDRTPMRAVDSPVPLADLAVWADYLRPAGFGEAVGVPLHTWDGRYLGVLGMHTETAKPASQTSLRLLATLAPHVAHAVDPLRTVAALTSIVADATAGVVLTRAGNTVALPGLGHNRLLTTGSALLDEVAARYNAGDRSATFLVPDRGGDQSPYLRVTVLACRDEPPHHLAAVALLSQPGDLRQLTWRELTALGMFIHGWQPRHVARHLQISAHSVITAAEAAQVKLGAPSRAAAVIVAAALGLYLPPSLASDHR